MKCDNYTHYVCGVIFTTSSIFMKYSTNKYSYPTIKTTQNSILNILKICKQTCICTLKVSIITELSIVFFTFPSFKFTSTTLTTQTTLIRHKYNLKNYLQFGTFWQESSKNHLIVFLNAGFSKICLCLVQIYP